MSELTIGFEIENIGPHERISFIGKSSSLKTAIYANNGSGKTFISRLFRLIENPTNEQSDKLLSFTKNKGKMKFHISNNINADEANPKKLEIEISKGCIPKISSSLPYIFHVFNSDYVHDNIESLNYKPNEEIEGYILRKVQIDLTKKELSLKNKNIDLSTLEENLKDRINTKKEGLNDKDLGIRKNITEYTNFTSENIFNKKYFNYTESKSFEELKKENTLLNTLPDDLIDVNFNDFNASTNFFEDLEKILKNIYTKSSFAEEFKIKIKKKQNFIEKGLDLKINNECPFCEQSFNEEALKLIDRYIKYLEDEEAKIISQINDHISNIDKLKKQIKDNRETSVKSKTNFDNLKKYLPSFKEKNIELLPDYMEIEDSFNDITSILNDKKDNISKSFSLQKNTIAIKKFLEKAEKIYNANDTAISKINKTKNNTNEEKLNIKKKLCKSKYLETMKIELSNIDNIMTLKKEIINLEKDIETKKSQAKVLRKQRVSETFEHFLNVFFAEKYTFNKDSFCLKFDTHDLINNASDVLSDGEKNIVAFCFFLAETHNKIETEDDYGKLFFIIDDPISSLDFHYVYAVAQIIRRLNIDNIFPIGERLKYIVLTHNIEFMSILIRNKIIGDGRFILEKSKIEALQKELIMPYEEHLRDVYEVAENKKKPTHTTPNSIRHILETINKFEKPDLDFKDYCDDVKLLQNENEFLYALIHDSSHGNHRTQTPFTPDMITKGCVKVIEIIADKFDGQIKIMKKEIKNVY